MPPACSSATANTRSRRGGRRGALRQRQCETIRYALDVEHVFVGQKPRRVTGHPDHQHGRARIKIGMAKLTDNFHASKRELRPLDRKLQQGPASGNLLLSTPERPPNHAASQPDVLNRAG